METPSLRQRIQHNILLPQQEHIHHASATVASTTSSALVETTSTTLSDKAKKTKKHKKPKKSKKSGKRSKRIASSPPSSQHSIDEAEHDDGGVDGDDDHYHPVIDDDEDDEDEPQESHRLKKTPAVPSSSVRLTTTSTTLEGEEHHDDVSYEPSTINVCVYKSASTSKIGIRLKVYEVPHHDSSRSATKLVLRVESIVADGLLADSPLRAGDDLIRINTIPCSTWTALDASNYIKQLDEGLLTLVAKRNLRGSPQFQPSSSSAAAVPLVCTETAVFKTHTKVGIVFCTVPASPSSSTCLQLKSINAKRMLRHAMHLSPGDTVLAINRIPCREIDAETAKEMVRSSQGYVSLITTKTTHSEQEPSNCLDRQNTTDGASLTEERDDVNESSEASSSSSSSAYSSSSERTSSSAVEQSGDSDDDDDDENNNRDNAVVDAALATSSTASETKNDSTQLHSAEQQNQQRRTPSFVKSLPSVIAKPEVQRSYSTVATVTTMVPIQDPDASLSPSSSRRLSKSESGGVRAGIINLRLYKPERTIRLGITFERKDGSLVIKSLSPTGWLAQTENVTSPNASSLKVGDVVVRLNNVLCSHWTPEQAVRLIQETIGYVYLVVQPPLRRHEYPTMMMMMPMMGGGSSNNVDRTMTETTIFKQEPTQKVGLQFYRSRTTSSVNGKLCVKDINPSGILGGGGGPFGVTIDDYVHSINGILCDELDVFTAIQIVRLCPHKVTLRTVKRGTGLSSRVVNSEIVSEVAASIPMGRSLSHDGRSSSSSNSSTGSADTPDMEFVDDEYDSELEGLDYSTMPHASTEAVPAGMTDSSTTTNTNPDNLHGIVTATTTATTIGIEPRLMSATVVKQRQEAKLGIGLRTDSRGRLVIAHIATDGLLASSPFRAGFRLLSIDTIDCSHWDPERVVKYLKKCIGQVTFVAQNIHGNPSYVQAMTTKHHIHEVVGITFGRNSECLRIVAIRPTSSFAHSVLNAEDTVIAINNVPCQHVSSLDAAQLIGKSPRGVISVLSKTSSTAGVVVSSSAATSSSSPPATQRLY